MNISHKWLKQYIKLTLPPEVLEDRLSMLGLEIESVTRPGSRYAGFVVGEVTTVSPHPNADRLTICQVDIGEEVVQIVCGAPNVAEGQKVAVGLQGATVPRNQHDPQGEPFQLSRATIRGVESHGMICSEYELDLGKDKDGILVLDPQAKVGTPLASYLGMDDVIYDVEITPNRPDWLSHFGVAREIGVLTGKPPSLPRVSLREARESITRYLSVRVEDKTNCMRFAARLIRGVKIGASPVWLQHALRSVGLRPRNNVVDVTNYVMLECGQPLHAFDYALLRGAAIVVRRTRGGEFTTLDERTHQLPADAVMVCDAEREISIAGIMGGRNSEISEQTVDVVLESANWNPSSIRRTARALGITSDASQRFERGADPNAVPYAIDRAAQLILECAGGELMKGWIDVYPKKVRERRIPLRTERVNAVLGTSLPEKEIALMLSRLGLRKASGTRGAPVYIVPTFRVDLEREIDLIEEVARVYGYDRIEVRTASRMELARAQGKTSPRVNVGNALVGLGYREALCDSLVDARRAALGGRTTVTVLNPKNSEAACLRTSLIPGLLDAVARNQSFGNTDLRLFEIGRVFWKAHNATHVIVEDFAEEERLAMVITGAALPLQWGVSRREVDIFDLKGDLQMLTNMLSLDKTTFISYSTHETLAEKPVAIEINGVYAGYFGSIRDEVLKMFGIERPVFVADIALAAVGGKRTRRYTSLPRYPKVRRDVALVVNGDVEAGAVEQAIRRGASALLTGVELFDVYTGPNVPQGKKSLAYVLELQSQDQTLTEDQIEAEMRRIVLNVERETGAALRGQLHVSMEQQQ